MEQRYFLNNTDAFSLIDEFYPIKGGLTNESLDINSLTYENLEKFINRINDLLEDVRIEECGEKPRQLGDLDFLEEPAKGKLKELFSDPNLTILGHGGDVETVLNSGHFYCKYQELDSHFIPLEWGESLDSINHWVHHDSHKILFLALNKNEINPIYQDIDSENQYSDFRYEIPLEYFAGYYDRDTKDFILNPNFKKEHDYNSHLTGYTDKVPRANLNGSPQEINDFYQTLRELAYQIYKASNGLSQKGYEGLCNQYVHFVEVLRNHLLVLNEDYLRELENQRINDTIALLDELDDNQALDFDDEEIDWGMDEEPGQPKL